MENIDNAQKPSIAKVSLKYGVLIGLGLIAVSLFFQFVIPDQGRASLYLSIIIMVIGIYLATKAWRDNYKDGYLSYSQGLGFGTLTFFFSALVLGFFTFILFQFIYPQGLEAALIEAEMEILRTQPNITEQELDLALSFSRIFINPIAMGLLSMIFYSFLGFLGSLITSAIVKKEVFAQE
jgi:hypothetical protein